MRGLLGIILSILSFSCKDTLTGASHKAESIRITEPSKKELPSEVVIHGDERLDEYFPLLKNKKIGLVVNQSSILKGTHLIDTLLSSGLMIKKIFAPEHGIRGKADAGEKVSDGKDKTGIPIISLYGNHKKPYKTDVEGLDVVVFDLQDVGVRFYTYISTMHYVMEACAENNVKIIILDRPNPNGDYVAGPVLEKEHKSFVGLHPIPIVHGLTVGELAKMINGEKWLKDSLKADLKVITCKNYKHSIVLPLEVKPSPNLPTLNSIRWYPSLCLLEATVISVGRGTHMPFEVIGNPYLDSVSFPYTFTPKSIEGMSKHPKHQDKMCYGLNLQKVKAEKFSFNYLVKAHKEINSADFFTNKAFFYKLCGTKKVYNALVSGKEEQEIEDLFYAELEDYRILRKKYLLYPE